MDCGESLKQESQQRGITLSFLLSSLLLLPLLPSSPSPLPPPLFPLTLLSLDLPLLLLGLCANLSLIGYLLSDQGMNFVYPSSSLSSLLLLLLFLLSLPLSPSPPLSSLLFAEGFFSSGKDLGRSTTAGSHRST